jgi:uncharacterized protein YkwD
MPARRLVLLPLLLAAGCPGDANTTTDDTGSTAAATADAPTTGGPASASGTDSDSGDDSSTGDAPSPVWDTPYCHPVKDGPGWPPAFQTWEEEVLQRVNEARALGHDCDTKGSFGPAAPLTMNASLRCAARKHAADMSARNFFDHTNPDGETFDQRIEQAGYGSYNQVGENIAGGSDLDNAKTAVDGWLESDGHCANIMNPNYTEFGAGAYEGSGELTFYWTQEFGRPN